MKMNYNSWFYRTHAYLQNAGKKGLIDYNDTKYVNLGDRYKKLVDLESEIFSEQPFGLISNRRGFNKLIDLLERSNYTFEDINDSLIDAYKHSLTNAMSRMLVNTHAVMFKCDSTYRSHVSADRFSRYYIIEAPFNQLHFGDRDEFIRQQLQKMHTEANDKYIPLSEFNTSPYTDLLGFTLMCCVNGKISNDAKVALDDKGFKFKISWPYDRKKVDFIVYKLDASKVYTTTVKYQDLVNDTGFIKFSCPNAMGQHCIINLYDARYASTTASVPNFGVLQKDGVSLINLQQYTLNQFENLRTNDVSVTIYAIQYFHEIPNLYPAVNYYDIVDTRRVYVETGERVLEGDKHTQVYSSSTTDLNDLELCTPPIVIDRSATTSFSTIVSCLKIKDSMLTAFDDIRKAGISLSNTSRLTQAQLDNIKAQLTHTKKVVAPCYKTYIEGALLTSLVDSERLERFEKFITNLDNFINDATIQNYTQYTDFNLFPELYDNQYVSFVEYIVTPFVGNALAPFENIIKTSSNYFVMDNAERFNRPISEQCFITMIYDRTDDCWIFDVPNIEHFKGVGNSFYINDNLKGDEIFKFFVLYTDTEGVSEQYVQPFELDQVFDFDVFYDEVSKHIGYIRYWNTENKLMKLCKTIYSEYTPEKAVQVLSKILKRKLDGVDILDQYPSAINYEPSNASSLNWNNYNEFSDEAPFAVNFLFYTISLMNGNEDKLQAYLYRQLIKRMHSNRYADIDVSSIIDRSYMLPVNYSVLSISPIRIDPNKSSIPITSGIYAFYGMTFLTDNLSNMFTPNPYRYTFNMYENEKQYPLITENDYTEDSYLGYADISAFNAMTVTYRHDIYMARLLTRYLIAAYEFISDIQTYYKHSYNSNEDNMAALDKINDIAHEIATYAGRHVNDFINPATMDVAMSAAYNIFESIVYTINGTISSIRSVNFNGRTANIEKVSGDFLQLLESVYKNTGFDDAIAKRVRNMYIHFKKINGLQSVYDFLKWVEGIDLELIQNLDNMRSENDNDIHGSNVFAPYATAFANWLDPVSPGRNTAGKVRGLISMIDGLFTSNYTSHFEPIVSFCEDIIENWIFDFFILDGIEYDKTITYNQKPYAIIIDAPAGDRFHPKKGQIIDVNSTMIIEPIVENINGAWVIKDISKICEYAFFLGTDLNVSMRIVSQSGATIDTIAGTMKFFRIGSSADDMVTFNQFPNMKNSCIDIQNVHEEFTLDSNSHVVNKKFGKMNYELLVGNSYCQLDHTSELVLERKTMLQGSIDRLYLPGYLLNKLTAHEFGQHTSFEVYFKASQVLHLTITNTEMTSVGGKYFVGQTLYLVTDDNKAVFPVVVTAVDMSESEGFVEAEIDQLRASWFKLDDIADIKRYMENPITCTVLDDNICNFLDEFTNADLRNYQIPEFPRALDPCDEDNPNAYSMPGDPIYVTSNAPYVYTRLNWIFNQDIPNRFMDTHPQDHNMIYVGSTDTLHEGDPIKLKLINHTFEPFTDPENYPILREEPDDHFVWEEELKVFNDAYTSALGEYQNQQHAISRAWQGWYSLPSYMRTQENFNMFKITIADMEASAQRIIEKGDRIKSYINQLETPTTWYNVRTYETAKTYIDNGRANLDFGRITNIRNIPYTDELQVYVYDWEHHYWIDPSLYTVNVETLASVKIGEYEDYNTRRVMHSIVITPEDGFPTSRKVLVYFAYDQSDVFDTIDINPKTCSVRFKPLLTLDNTVVDYDPYAKINIRKQFDGHITFEFDSYSEIPDFSQDGYLFKLPNESGKQIRTPNIRFVGMKADNAGTELGISDFDVYIKMPYPNVTSTDKYLIPEYSSTVVREIDGFVPGQTIKLICISNNARSSYDGNISSVMFEAYTIDDGGTQKLQITNSTLPWYIGGSFTCTVFKDNMYPHSGGVVSITVVPYENDVVDGNWVKLININNCVEYKILPEEFALVPKSPISGKIAFEFKSEYEKRTDAPITVTTDDINLINPYLFYYNADKSLRYPIGEVRKNQHKERLVIDTSLNTDIQVVKNTFLSICRYAIQKIPKDGIIDMTGYLPTPLSRDHYEFWVNGRCIKDPSDIVILSPTSIQLLNLKSLRNFECVELVDDFNDSPLSTKGPVYIDLNGKVYASHKLAVNSGESVYMENIRYMFNANNQQPMHTHTRSIISNPNNRNIEQDILETVEFSQDNPTYYEELFNLPSINGVDIYDPKSYHLGFIETPNKKILEMFDRVWRREQCTDPLFPSTHMRDLDLIDGEKVILHTKYSGKDDMYLLYATGISDGFFTFYISRSPSAKIDETSYTLKILPFIRTGVFVYVDKSFQGEWLCCTHPNVKPIKIM